MQLLSRLEQDHRLDGVVAAGQRAARIIRPGKVRDALHGVWLGHPLHPSGVDESATHALMMAEISVPLLLTLLCEINPLVPGVSVVTAGVHEATAIWDVRSAIDGGREVRPAEQHIHSFLESLPFIAMASSTRDRCGIICLTFTA